METVPDILTIFLIIFRSLRDPLPSGVVELFEHWSGKGSWQSAFLMVGLLNRWAHTPYASSRRDEKKFTVSGLAWAEFFVRLGVDSNRCIGKRGYWRREINPLRTFFTMQLQGYKNCPRCSRDRNDCHPMYKPINSHLY